MGALTGTATRGSSHWNVAGLLYLSQPTDSFIFSKQNPCALIPHGHPLGSELRGTASLQICVLTLYSIPTLSPGLKSQVLPVKIYVGHSMLHTCE